MKAAFYTLGCKVNQYETQALSEALVREGFLIVPHSEDADVYIINSCTVTAESDKKTRQAVRRFKRQHPDSTVVLTGCMPQAYPEAAAELDSADIVAGNRNNCDIPSLIINYLKEKNRKINIIQHENHDSFVPCSISSFDERTRAAIKIEDGCNRFCSYCIIPYARGRIRSRSMQSIINEVKSLAKQGFVEIVLVGIHLASYGKDLEKGDLISVVEELNKIEGIQRIRLGSLEPKCLTEDFVNRIKKAEKVCPHFHVSLQSGCDATLKRMNRKYNMQEYFEGLERLRTIPDVSVTTDVMVGFAGETEEEFEESLTNVEKCGFSSVHIFPYSIRKGTPAAKMPNQVPESIKAERAARMAQLTERMQKEFEEKYIGKTVEVLFEQDGKGHTTNFIQVHAEGGEGIQKVVITHANQEGLEGKLC